MEHPDSSSTRFEFPPFMVLLLLVVIALFGGLLGSGLAYLIATVQGQDLLQLMSGAGSDMPLATRNLLRQINMASHVMTFTFPVVLLTLWLYRRDWLRFLRLDRAPVGALLLVGCLFMLSVFPVAQFAYWLNKQIPLPEWAGRMESSATEMLQGLMIMDSPGEFLFNLLIMAVLPAVGEELLFRGVIQQKLEEQVRNGHAAVWITAVIFSAVHFQFEGFLARMVLGAALGYLFYWTRNLWIPIIAHFLNNGVQVAAQYYYGDQVDLLQAEEAVDVNSLLLSALAGAVFMVLTARYLMGSREPESRASNAGSDQASDL